MRQSTFQSSNKSGNARLKAAFKSHSDFADEISDADVFADIAINLYRLRKSAGVRQKDLAQDLCVQQSNISRYESPGYTGYTIKMLLRYVRKLNGKLRISIEPPTSNTYMHMSLITEDVIGSQPVTFVDPDGSQITTYPRSTTTKTISFINAKGASNYANLKLIK